MTAPKEKCCEEFKCDCIHHYERTNGAIIPICDCHAVPKEKGWEQEAAKTAIEAHKLTKNYALFSERIYKGFQSALSQQKREIVRLVEGKKHDGKEWIAMMNAANSAGFSVMTSPEDFISGRNAAIADILKAIDDITK